MSNALNPDDFDFNKIYQGTVDRNIRIVKRNAKDCMVLCGGGTNYYIGDVVGMNVFYGTFDVITFSSLPIKEMTYLTDHCKEWFIQPVATVVKSKADCTCDTKELMAKGCQCGGLKRDKAKGILAAAFKDIEQLGVYLHMDFGCSIKSISEVKPEMFGYREKGK